MKQRVLACVAVWVLLVGPHTQTKHHPKPVKHPAPKVSACVTETLAAAAGTTCTRGGVTFTYSSDPYAATGAGAPGPSSIAIVMDSNGSNATLVGNQSNFTGGWSVGPGQMWSFTIRYTVQGTTGKFSLAQLGAAATGDGSVVAKQTAGTVMSSITCTATAPCATPSSGNYTSYTPATAPQDVGVTLTLNGGTNGTASISQLSQHWQ